MSLRSIEGKSAEGRAAGLRRRWARCGTARINVDMKDGTRHSGYLRNVDRERVWMFRDLTCRDPLLELDIDAIDRVEVRDRRAFVVPWELPRTS